MPRKLKNGKYAFKGGCIGEKGKDGKYKLVAVRKKKAKKTKKVKNVNKVEDNVEEEVEIEKQETKKRRSQKKTFTKQISNQTGGHNSNLDITVHMLREFYSKNV
jgi:hypothetical protein